MFGRETGEKIIIKNFSISKMLLMKFSNNYEKVSFESPSFWFMLIKTNYTLKDVSLI